MPPTPPPDRAPSLADMVWAAAAGFAALALYLATLQPDFGGPEDTPKFQFLGYVLGTAHPPGYPLYVWLSHVFVMLPIGSIAYRANLFSAVMAALACALAFVIGRQIGAGRWASLCAALALAAGASFWRSAVFAEVYSLAAVMAALTVSLLLAWNARPGTLRILAATGALALGLGNHLTIIGIIPACVLYVLLRHRRMVTPRLVAAAAVIVLLGVAQYGLIIVRTHQEAPYLESRATSVRDLIGVVTAERFAGQRFAFGPRVLLTDHLPALASVIGRELGVAGALLLAAGLISASRHRNGGAALLVGSAAGMLGMVLNLTGDLNGFITPVMVLLWPVAALGVDALAERLRGLRGTASIAGVTAIAAAAVMPLANIAANYRDADQSEHTAPARFLRSAFRQLPDRAGVVVEDYFYDMAIDYLTFTGEAGPRRGIVRTGFNVAEVRTAAQGNGGPSGRPRRIFAFGGGSLFLGTDGLHFDRAEIAGTPLSEWLPGLPRNTVIVFATAYVPGPLDLTGPERSHARPVGRPRAFEAFALRAGTTDAAWRGNDDGVSMTVGPDVLVSSPAFAGSLVASANAGGARILLAGQEIASVSAGVVLGVFSPEGKLLRAEVFPGSDPVRVPFQEALYELTGEAPCVALGNEWRDVSPTLRTGSWIATLQTIGSVVIETAVSPASGSVHAQSTQLMGDGSTGTSASAANADGAQVIATEMSRSSERRPVFRLSMDRSAVQARARVKPSGARTAVTVCSHQPSRPLFEPGSNAGILRADFESEAYYGAGWSGAERNDTGPFRRGEPAATLLLPLAGPYTYHLSLDVTSANDASIALAVDGQPAGTCEPRLNVRCELTLPVTALRAGVIALTLERIGPPPGARGPAMIFRGARLDRRRGVDAAAAR